MKKNIKELLNPKKSLLLIIIFAITVRIIFFVGIGFNDDSYYLEFTEKIYKGLKFIPTNYVWSVRVGVYLPIVLSWQVFGVSEFSTSLIFLAYSLCVISVVYLIGKELFDRRVGLMSSFLISIFPVDVIYATQVGPDVPFQLFSSASLLFFLKAYRWENRYKLYSFLSGGCLGVAYLFKEMVFLMLIIFLFYILCDMIASKRNATFLINRKLLVCLLIFSSAFSFIHFSQNVYLQQLTGEWFFSEKAKEWTLKNDGNKNDDFTFYPKAMLNQDRNRFEWIHNKPLLGFIYYFVLGAIIILLLRRKISKNNVLLFFWLMIFFFFFQYGLHFISTVLVNDGMRPRHLRFLLPMSVPAALIIGQALDFRIRRFQRLGVVFRIILLAFFVTSSAYYTHQSRTFLRNGMGYIRETVGFLTTLTPKRIYLPDFWTLSKFKFFSGYNDTFVDRLDVYECNAIYCKDSFFDHGEYIDDAYIVTFVNPYTYINTRSSNNKVYPALMTSVPSHWKLLKTIQLENYGIFNKFEPKIFYADKQ